MARNEGQSAVSIVEHFNFDRPAKFSNGLLILDFPVEEDMVNLGAWLQLYHPNFFEGSTGGQLRYMIWLLISLLIQTTKFIFVVKFYMTVISDVVTPLQVYRDVLQIGRANTYQNWIDNVKNKSSLAGVKDDSIENWSDYNKGIDLHDAFTDPKNSGIAILSCMVVMILFTQITY